MVLARYSSVLFVASLFAQDTTIKTNVPLVVIPVSVMDQRGHFVPDLKESDFAVLDNGIAQAVHVDDPSLVTAPLDIVVLIQTSDISNSALLKIRKVGTMIQDAVAGANGDAAVITFADRVELVQDFTSNDDDLSKTFGNLKSVTDTRDGKLLDAVGKGLDLLKNRAEGRRSVLVIIGESKDRGSETKLEDLLPRIQTSGVTIYSLAYSAYLTAFTTKGAEYKPPEGGRGWILDAITEAVHASKQDTCKLLVGASGGRQLKFETRAKLEDDLIRLGGEIHSRYIVSFVPGQQSAPGFHKLSVSIKQRPQLHVEARPGYLMESNHAR